MMRKKIMTNNNYWFAILAVVLLAVGCESVEDSNAPNTSGDWLIPRSEIHDGGPGRDGIPALSKPEFVSAASAGFLGDNELVIGFKVGNEVKAYPHQILDWHEIINDGIDDVKISITYCPLTGSGIGWNRVIDGEETTFGVSGLLYNTNLIPYDRKTGSNWSQMKLQCVNGKLKGQWVETIPVVETTWGTLKQMYPNTLVASTNTGFSRAYGVYPYGDYKTNNRLIFPIDNDDKRFARKERVLGVVVDENAKVYRFNSFKNGIQTINDNFRGADLVIAGSQPDNFIVAYQRTLSDGTVLTFSPLQNSSPAMMVDQEGNQWNIFGEAISGPREGTKLKGIQSFIAYWFAWGTFYHDLDIYE